MSLAVQVTCSFFDTMVEDSISPRGRVVVLGGTDALAIPRPAGLPYLAKLVWKTPAHISITDGHGKTQQLLKNGVVVIEEGPIRLECRLVQRFRLRRVASLATMASTVLSAMLLSIVLGAGAITAQGHMAVNDVWCGTWLAEVRDPKDIPVIRELYSTCRKDAGSGGAMTEAGRQSASDRLAEYMQKVLKENPEESQSGRLEKGDRQFGDRERQEDNLYMPAGDKGSFDKMGGAEQVGLQPVRTETRMDEIKPEPKPKKRRELLASDKGTPVVLPTDPEDAIAEADPDEETDQDPDETPTELVERQEDREGWGFKDWYDQEDAQLDDVRIEAMKNLADRILQIDPNDSEALAMMAYYQYLDEDMEGAEKTYERYVQLNPDDHAGYNNMALVYKRLGQYEREEQLYEIALAMAPDDRTALNNLAVTLGHQHRFEEAHAVLDKLEIIDPGEPYAYLHRAKVYAEQGNDEQALVYLEKALQGMKQLNTLLHIEFRQDIRIDPSFDHLRKTRAFRSLLWRYYGDDTPLPE